MAIDMFLELTDKKAGKIAGEAKKPQEGKIVVLNYSFHVDSPRDMASGLASGKRRHYPFGITKLVDKTSPALFQALTTNSIITKAVLLVRRGTDIAGKFDDVTYELMNGSVINIQSGIDVGLADGDAATDATQKRNTEFIEFTFQKISIFHDISKTEASDDWAMQS